MANPCPCSQLDWLPEYYELEHHPDCQQVQTKVLDVMPYSGSFYIHPFDVPEED